MNPTLSRAEVSALLDLDLSVIDALVESGRILCHVRGGEPRIPINQLEAFFRDSLVKLYEAEVEDRQSCLSGQAGLPVLHEPEPEPEPAPPPVIVATPTPAPAPPPVRVVREAEEPPEQRVASRYVPLRQIDGIFGDTKFSMLQLSTTGLRIRHREPLMPGTEAKVSFALMKPARSFVVRARVVWTSLARAGEERFSISGLRVIEHQDRLARAIDLLKSAHQLQPERRVTARRTTDGLVAIDDVSDEEIALVTGAVHKFAADPVEAGRWYSRARFAMADETVRRTAPEKPRDREEILGIWEYLERQVEIPKIAGIVGWMRAAG